MTQPLLLAIILSFLWTPGAQAQRNQYLWQTNSQGNDIHIFRLGELELHRRLEVGPEPHGIAVPQDGRVVYVSLEANGRDREEVLWIDPVSLEIEHRLEVGPEPHAIATTSDGRWVYVPCRDGHYWVVDAAARNLIELEGKGYWLTFSPDSRYAFVALSGQNRVAVVDTASKQIVHHLPAGNAPKRNIVIELPQPASNNGLQGMPRSARRP